MLNVEAFGRNLQLERKRQTPPLTQEGIADMTDISVQTISGYEMGTKSPTLKNAIKIANALSLSLDYLCGGSNMAEQNETEWKIETLSDIQTIFDILCEKISGCDVWTANNSISLSIENCPQITKYYTDYLTMKELMDAGTITPDIFRIWKDGATKDLKRITIEDYEIPF